MKKFIFFARVYTWWTLVLPLSVSAQDHATVYPNYVVIGAFAIHENAVEFSDEANKNNFPAKFEMNPNRNLYYVYVLTTHDRPLAFSEALKLRTDTKYFDTWVYSGALGEHALAVRDGGGDQDFNPGTGGQLNAVSSDKRVAHPTDENVSALSATGERVLAGNTTGGSDPSEKALESGTAQVKTNGKASRRKKNAKGDDQPDNATEGLSGEQNQLTNRQADGQQQTSGLQPSDQISRNGAGEISQTTSGQSKLRSQTSQQGVKPDPTTRLTSTQNTKETTGTAGPNYNQGTTQPGNVKPGQHPVKPNPVAAKDQASTTATLPDDNLKPGVENLQSENTIAATLTKETDKALTDAGRKALSENRERQAALGPPPNKATMAPLTKAEIAGKNFYFYLFRGDNLEVVDGEVDAVDVEKSRRMATYQGNTAVEVLMPSGKTKQMSFVCQVFGYRKQQREFDPSVPPEDLYLDDKGNLVVPFELVRMQKGDIAIMYNVFFFKDAAVMRPESRYEVNNLLDLLAENPTYKIMIHGHTNGNAAGKIIRMDTGENFYSLTGTNQGFGSAKELSEERAIVIRDFLVNSGISADRMQVKAWGGKKPIHDRHAARANENVRVEIEILSQ